MRIQLNKLLLVIVFLQFIFIIVLLLNGKDTKTINSQELWNTEMTEKQTTKLSEAEAIEIVSNLPEVKEFQKLLEGVSKTTSFRALDDDNHWSIQVYEDVQDSETEGHSATFSWFKVDKNTGEVTKQF